MNGSTILNIEIQDSNDHTPEFWFEGCLKDKLQIKMEEVGNIFLCIDSFYHVCMYRFG